MRIESSVGQEKARDFPGRDRVADINLGPEDRIDLKSMFPVSVRSSVRACVWPILVWVGALGCVHGIWGARVFVAPRSEAQLIAVIVVVLLGVGSLLRFLYEELERHALHYETDGYRLVITRGIVFRREGSLPLLPVSEIFIRRGLLDLLCGLYEVNIATPVNAGRAFGLISGLGYKEAHGLQQFLAKQLNRQIFVSETRTDRVQ